MSTEADPTGRDSHAPGAKLDAGKPETSLLLDMARALTAVAEVGTYGMKKYSRGGWQHVPEGQTRYMNALIRHLFKSKAEAVDTDTGYCHEAHAAWNALALLELKLRQDERMLSMARAMADMPPLPAMMGDDFRVGG